MGIKNVDALKPDHDSNFCAVCGNCVKPADRILNKFGETIHATPEDCGAPANL